MGPCTLQISSRIIIHSEGGPPDAEYALFNADDVELASAEDGVAYEVGYRTTVGDAKDRLRMAGITRSLGEAAAAALGPELAAIYARGSSSRRAAPYLGPYELFEGRVFDSATRRYEGFWLDLATLSADTKLPHAAAIIQTLYLVQLLEEREDNESVELVTADYTRARKSDERTFKVVPLEHAKGLPAALKALSLTPRSIPAERDQGGPTRAQLLDATHERRPTNESDPRHTHIMQIEHSLRVRDRPATGPLSEPELWAIEEQLSMGDARGVIPKIEVIERSQGRRPATTYLRAKAALVAGIVDPRSIAERVSSLTEAPNSFEELDLLAAEAWTAAGEHNRAIPYALALVTNARVSDSIRAAAADILRSAETAEAVPPGALPRVLGPSSERPRRAAVPISSKAPRSAASSSTSVAGSPTPSAANRVSSMGDALRPETAFGSERSPVAGSQATVERLFGETGNDAVTVYPPAAPIPRAAIASSLLPPPTYEVSIPPLPPLRSISSVKDGAVTPVPPSPGDVTDLDDDLILEISPASSRKGMPTLAPMQRQTPRSLRPALPEGNAYNLLAAEVQADLEHADTLSIPPELTTLSPPDSSQGLPKDGAGARRWCIQRAHLVGRDVQTKYHLRLPISAEGIETMQWILRDKFADGRIPSDEHRLKVYDYGAMLSEILVRELGAFWKEIHPTDIAQWRMCILPNIDIWPFGRVMRFIAKGHYERDLVSYFFELKSRARASQTR